MCSSQTHHLCHHKLRESILANQCHSDRILLVNKEPQEPQDVEMSMGSNFQEMCFVESQTDDGGDQPYVVLKSTYANTVLDVTSSWAHSWCRREIEGGEVFYQPEVRELYRGINQV